jgi:hypothetical protein
MKVGELIDNIKVGQVALGVYENEQWFITKTPEEQIRICDNRGVSIGEMMPLRIQTLKAKWKIIK